MNRLIKHIIILILSLPLLLIGCTILDEETPIGGESGKSYIAVNVEDLLTRGSADEMPTVKSIRLLVFGENGEYLENRKVAISSSSIPSIPLTLPTNVYGNNIYVYAVLNEDDSYCNTLESGVALSTELAKFTNKFGDRTAFLNLMNQPLKFNPANADASAEKIFLMYAKNENVLVNSKATQDNPFPVNLSETEDVPRSMAKITIESINGDADADAAKVFVTDVRIENIPTSYSLSGENAGTDMTFANIAMGKGIDYTDRNWDGIVAATYSGSVEESVKTDDRCYLMSRDAYGSKTNDSNRWLFNGTKSVYTKQDDLGKGDCGRSGSITTIIDELDNLNSFKITNQSVSIDETNISFLKNSRWNLNIDESIYVPENNPQDDKSVTSIAITLMIKNPVLNNVTDDKLASEAEMGYYTYTVGDYNSPFPASTNTGTVQTFFMNNAKEEYYWYNVYYWYLDNFKGFRIGSFKNVSFDSSMNGITTSWNDYKSYTFHIPVNNKNVDGDYSIKRNNHYQVSLKVTKDTYNAIANSRAQSRALSADQCPLDVSVKVSPLQ